MTRAELSVLRVGPNSQSPYRSWCDLVAQRGLCFLFRWWWRHFELTEKVIKATLLKKVEGGGLLVGKFGKGLAKTSLVVGGEVKEPSKLSSLLLGFCEVLDLCKKTFVGHNHVEIGAPGKSHNGVLDRVGELHEFASRNHETDLSLGPLLLLFRYGGRFGCVRVVWKGVNDKGCVVGGHL